MPSRPSKPSAKKAVAKKAAPAKKVAKASKAKVTPAKKTPAKKAVGKTTAKKASPGKAAPAAKKAAPARTKAVKTTPATTKKSAPAPAPVKAQAKRTKAPVLDKFLQEQVALLQQERQTYTEQAEALKAEADALAQEMEPGDIQFDEESGEGATMNIDRERDLALSAQARAAVEEIDHALAKIQNGAYGACESCGQPIPKARLKALPYARLCVACKSGGLSRR
jgi:DnaK suppressor protein